MPTYVALSILHVPYEDAELLRLGGLAGVSASRVGYLVGIPELPEDDVGPAMARAGMSAAFVRVVEWCRQEGYLAMSLEVDGPEIVGLPTFVW